MKPKRFILGSFFGTFMANCHKNFFSQMLSQNRSFEGVDYPFCEKNSVTEKGYIVWKISENEGGRVLFVFPGNLWKRPWLFLVWRGTFQLSSWPTSHSPQKVGSLSYNSKQNSQVRPGFEHLYFDDSEAKTNLPYRCNGYQMSPWCYNHGYQISLRSKHFKTVWAK